MDSVRAERWANAVVAACLLGFAAFGACCFGLLLLADPAMPPGDLALVLAGLAGAVLVAGGTLLGWRDAARARAAT